MVVVGVVADVVEIIGAVLEGFFAGVVALFWSALVDEELGTERSCVRSWVFVLVGWSAG